MDGILFLQKMTVQRFFSAVAALLLACFIPLGLYLRNAHIEYDSGWDNPDYDSIALFQYYDKNDDGHISLEEFKPIADRINFVNVGEYFVFLHSQSLYDVFSM